MQINMIGYYLHSALTMRHRATVDISIPLAVWVNFPYVSPVITELIPRR